MIKQLLKIQLIPVLKIFLGPLVVSFAVMLIDRHMLGSILNEIGLINGLVFLAPAAASIMYIVTTGRKIFAFLS